MKRVKYCVAETFCPTRSYPWIRKRSLDRDDLFFYPMAGLANPAHQK